MNCSEAVVLDLSEINVELNQDEQKIFSLFPVDQGGKKMLDGMILVSSDNRTYVVQKPVGKTRMAIEERRAKPIGWNVDFRRGAVF